MALNLYAPGTRKGNRFYIARGIVNGQVREFNTYTTDEKAARKRKAELESAIKAESHSGLAGAGKNIRFAQAAQRYIDFRNPSTFDRQCIERIIARIGRLKIREIIPADLHDMAASLYPHASAATRNRNALRPAITILHHAADDRLCDWIRVRKFPEPPRKKRAVSRQVAVRLIEATDDDDDKHRLLVWLFHQGTRISATLRVQWEDINLTRKTVVMDIRKGKEAVEKPLHDATLAELMKVPRHKRSGPVFPWKTRWGVRWLGTLLPGVKFTAHMARHTHGTALNDQGAGLFTIMGSIDHSDPKSTTIYQGADVEAIRAAINKINFSQSKSRRSHRSGAP